MARPILMLGYVDPSIVANQGSEHELVLQAVRDRAGLSLTRLRGRPEALVLQGYGRRLVVHGGLRGLTVGVVQRFGCASSAMLSAASATRPAREFP
jgi:hypothetical protein